MTIIKLTKNFLSSSGVNQVALAGKVGIHPTTLNRYLHGKIKPGTGEILANFLLARRACGALTATPTTPPGDAGAAEAQPPQEAQDA